MFYCISMKNINSENTKEKQFTLAKKAAIKGDDVEMWKHLRNSIRFNNVTPLEYLTSKEVAQILKVHENTVWRWLSEGSLKGVKIGGTWRIRREDLPISLRQHKKVD